MQAMPVNHALQTFSEKLSAEPFIVMITKLRFSSDLSQVEKFAINLIWFRDENPIPLLRFDGSRFERMHVHYFFKRPITKEYHNKPLEFETIQTYWGRIRENWHVYLAEFKENYI